MKHDLTKGPILKTLVRYSLPLVITNVVQILFHTADTLILSVMAGDDAVASVGACASLITLLVSLFSGFATGANVLVAQRIGAKNEVGVRRAVGTAIVIGLSSGTILMIFSEIFARDLLILMQCQPEVLDQATLYMQIYFMGMPFIMLYNFVAAILRASGDSVRPMTYMLISGVLNVGLNVLFVSVSGLAVAGVALATVCSHLVALILALVSLIRSKGACRIERKHLCIRRHEFIAMFKIALPTCLAAMCFYAANVVISASVNSISKEAMAANAFAGQFDNFIYTVGCAIATATAVMVGQNLGAGRLDRIKKTMGVSLAFATAVSLLMGIIFVVFSDFLLSILTDSLDVIAIAKDRMILLCLTYFLTTVMEVFSFSLRSLHRQTSVMVVSIFCGLVVRCTWVWLVWPYCQTLSMLFACFPISAVLATVCYLFIYKGTVKGLEKRLATGRSLVE